MKLTCPGCNAQYTVADERLNGRRVKVRCKRCGEAFSVDPIATTSQPRGEVYERPAARRRAQDADLFAGAATAGADGMENVESVDDVANVESARAAKSTSPALLTGERNESSVLFSLAALAKQAPASPAASVTESSSLIDIRALVSASSGTSARSTSRSTSTSTSTEDRSVSRADDISNLGGGGAFAPLFGPPFAPPVTFAPHDDDPTRLRRSPLAVGALALAVVATLGFAAFAAIRSRSPAPVATTATTATALTAASTAADVPSPGAASSASSNGLATAPSEPPPAATAEVGAAPARPGTPSPVASPARSAASTKEPRTVAVLAPTASPPSVATKCCPGESEIACHMRAAAGAACSAEPAGAGASTRAAATPFDRPAAARALGISVASCKRGDGPTGAGHVKVTFQPNGSASAVDMDAPYAGTATGSCVAQRYRGVSIPAFSGGPLSVGKSFAIE